MKQLVVMSTLIFGLTALHVTAAETALHSGGNVYHAPTDTAQNVDYKAHYSKLFDQLDSNHDGILQYAESQRAKSHANVRLDAGGYQSKQLSINYSNHPINKIEFIELQHVKMKQVESMKHQLNPQQWLSHQIG